MRCSSHTGAQQVFWRATAIVATRGWDEAFGEVVQHVAGVGAAPVPQIHIQLGLDRQSGGTFPRRLQTLI